MVQVGDTVWVRVKVTSVPNEEVFAVDGLSHAVDATCSIPDLPGVDLAALVAIDGNDRRRS